MKFKLFILTFTLFVFQGCTSKEATLPLKNEQIQTTKDATIKKN